MPSDLGESIAFFCNGKGDKLQLFAAEHFLQACPVCRIGGLGFYRFGHRSEYFVRSGAVGMENDTQTEAGSYGVYFIYDIIVKRLDAGETTVEYTGLQQSVGDTTDKDTENISDAKVCPARCLLCFFETAATS